MALQPYIRLVGMPGVLRALRALGKNTTELGLKRAMLQFGGHVLRAYQSVVPVDTSLSRRSLRCRVKSRSKNNVVLLVGPTSRVGLNRQNKSPWDYLHFPDHGTKHINAQRFAGKAFRRGKAQAMPILMRHVKASIQASRTT